MNGWLDSKVVMTKVITLFLGSLLVSAGLASAAGVLVNGDFESGDLSGWAVTTGGGSVTNVAVNSPFPSPTGSRSALLVDDAGTDSDPHLDQGFSNLTGTAVPFSFDFNLDGTPVDSAWVVNFFGDGGPAIAKFFIDESGASGSSFGLRLDGGGTDLTVALESSTWYRVSGTLNTSSNTMSGNISSLTGIVSGSEFTDMPWRNDGNGAFGKIEFDDDDSSTTNANLRIDNVNVSVPEPSTTTALIISMAAMIFWRRRI